MTQQPGVVRECAEHGHPGRRRADVHAQTHDPAAKLAEQRQVVVVDETGTDVGQTIAALLGRKPADESANSYSVELVTATADAAQPQLIGRVEDSARRQPLLFLGGAFLLGVAVSRFFKAAGGLGDGQGRRDYRSGYGSSYESGTMTDYRTGGYQGTGSMDTSTARSGELGSEGI